MSGIQQLLVGAVPAGAEADANFNYTTLLLPGSGTNGAQNNTFLDSSTNAFSITRNGNTTQGTFSPFSQTGWSNYFDGSGDFIQSGTNITLSGDFTVEAWIWTVTANQKPEVWVNGGQAGQFVVSTNFNAADAGVIFGATSPPGSGWSVGFAGSTALTANSWNHVAWVRSSNTITVYVNGVSGGTLSNSSSTLALSKIGAWDASTYDFNGYISNLRVNTTAVYTSAFTPPTSPLTAITGTSLLTCQSNRFVDNSTNGYSITVTGNPSVQAFSPFAPTAAYSAATNGGSGYFDGTGDYLSVANNAALQFGTGDFAVEFWIYQTSLTGYQTPYSLGYASGGDFLIQTGNGNGLFKVFIGGSEIVAETGTGVANAWNHIVVSRVGTTLRIFRNGSQTGSATNSSNINSSSTLTIGSSISSPAYPITGYMSGVQVLKGSGYTSVTVPTSPPTNITNTSLLCNFTNAGITDATAKNDLETVGNAQISNGQAKWGSTSMYFDGTGDRLQIPASQNSVFGTGDFTVECWIYVASNPAQFTCIVSNWAGADPSWILNFSNGSGNIRFNDNSTVYLTSSSALPTGQWNHIAVSRYGTSLKMFFNGIEVASATNSTSFGSGSAVVTVGGYYDNTYVLTGYIQDLRITKGIARYTANFTAPTKAFALQ